MSTALSLLKYTGIFIALMIPGFILGKKGKIQESALPSCSGILSFVAMPALVFVKLLELDISKLSVIGIICSIFIPAFVMAALYFISKPLLKNTADSEVLTFCSILPNCGFIGIPLSAAMFPDKPEITVYISIVNTVASVVLLTFGINILSSKQNKMNPRQLILSPVIIATLLGFVLCATGVSQKMPTVSQYASYLSSLCTPLSMLMLGFELSKLKTGKKPELGCLFVPFLLKLIISPLIAVIILALLKISGFNIDSEIINALFIGLAVPTAASAPTHAAGNGRNGEKAAFVTVMLTCLSIVTLPLLYLLTDLIFKIIGG